jgi:hypothetical protein
MGSAVGAKWIEIEGYGGAQASCKSKKEPVPRRNSASPMLADSWEVMGWDSHSSHTSPHFHTVSCPKKATFATSRDETRAKAGMRSSATIRLYFDGVCSVS